MQLTQVRALHMTLTVGGIILSIGALVALLMGVTAWICVVQILFGIFVAVTSARSIPPKSGEAP